MEKYAITIGRQLGSGGKLTGELLSQRLGIPCYDKELIQIASMESGLGKEFFERADEKNSISILGNYISFRSGFMGYTEINYLSNEMLFKIQSDVIRNLAEKESCIFVGRCADYILRNYKHCLKIFICAGMSDRIQRICKDCSIPEKEAKTLIEQTDKKRASYYNYFSNKTWGEAISYDICFNSSILGIENIVGLIENFVKSNFNER
ncbi:MAG: cytidylate kinase-like family protein [Dysgonamonadaceae bacterium]|jgi:cytidylate kinase|nr:cytidylate kinase-like family protein [Dysgonamonadaceae bacterium]